jgi:hypothetical protein
MTTPTVEISADAAPTASQRIARTGGQVGTGGFIIVIVAWLARLFGVDLDPGPGVEMPPEVTAAFIGLITLLAAWRMNPREKVGSAVGAVVVEATMNPGVEPDDWHHQQLRSQAARAQSRGGLT